MLELLYKYIPKCPICLKLNFDTNIICESGHFTCKSCFERMAPTFNKNCPICRIPMLNKPINNHWLMDFIDAIKNDLEKKHNFKRGDWVDYLHDNSWNYGKILDIQLDTLSFIIDCNYHQPLIQVPINGDYILTKHSITEDWRNENFIMQCYKIDIYICKHIIDSDSDYCSSEYSCNHFKIWIPSFIVYFCPISNSILCVYTTLSKKCSSIWKNINDKSLRNPIKKI